MSLMGSVIEAIFALHPCDNTIRLLSNVMSPAVKNNTAEPNLDVSFQG